MFDEATSTAPNDVIETSDGNPPAPPVPAAAPDLFRKIAELIRFEAARLEMRAWHLTSGGDDIDVGDIDVKDLEAVVCECGTSHCLAGWIVALTPGGLELERWVSQDWSFFSAHVTTDWWGDTAKTLGLTAPWITDYRRHGAAVPTPLVALAILEKGGWHQGVKGSTPFQPLFFLQGTHEARQYIEQLALEEPRRVNASRS